MKSTRAKHPPNANWLMSFNSGSSNKSTLTQGSAFTEGTTTHGFQLLELIEVYGKESNAATECPAANFLMLIGSSIGARASQPQNSCFGRCWRPLGRMTFLRAWQLKKVRSPSSITPEVIFTCTRDMQLLKQERPGEALPHTSGGKKNVPSDRSYIVYVIKIIKT